MVEGRPAKMFPQTESHVEHMDGFNPVMVSLMSRALGCPRLAQNFVPDESHRFAMMMDDKVKRTPHFPPHPHPYEQSLLLERSAIDAMCRLRRFCPDQRDVQQVPQLHHQRRHGPGVGLHHRPWIRTQVRPVCLHLVRLVYKRKRKKNIFSTSQNFRGACVRLSATHENGMKCLEMQ